MLREGDGDVPADPNAGPWARGFPGLSPLRRKSLATSPRGSWYHSTWLSRDSRGMAVALAMRARLVRRVSFMLLW